VDYKETFAPVAKYTSIMAIISLASIMGWSIHQMDVKTIFLNGVIEEEVYIEKPQGFEVHGRESHVCRLKKSFYRFKKVGKGTLGSIGICRAWSSPKVKRIPTYISYNLERILLCWCCMLMACSSWDLRSSFTGERRIWLLSLR
jgi:hypothetical protein